jgi:predicted NAD-dependent protein-ADP-ribosyltransferase YbiA (DUF1768 family)
VGLKANSEKVAVANHLLQDCYKKLSEAVSRSNWEEVRVQIMLDAVAKNLLKVADDMKMIQKQKDKVVER